MGAKGKKILFIEDEPDQVMMISLRLEKNGYEVISSMDGEEGFKMAIREKPSLILVDVVMPGIDGFEVCRRLRKDPATKHIPIISTTAAGMDDVERQCITAGADDCVRKPYDSADLLRKIHRLLEK
ncbi:MAG: response regulator [Candidatus Omnitrophota bacterium]|jgi:CheY-like chemotaxis protein